MNRKMEFDHVPGVGHAIGGIHYAMGDTEAGDHSMKVASRSVGVIGGSVGGFFVGGPPGAVVGGYAGGLVVDGITTGIDSGIHDEYRPSGTLETAQHVYNVATGDEELNLSSGDVFDIGVEVVQDVTGFTE